MLLQVLHAGGSFVQGSSAEVGVTGVDSGPEYLTLFQGGVHWSQWVNVLSTYLREVKKKTQNNAVV